jgi:hypothetical protein
MKLTVFCVLLFVAASVAHAQEYDLVRKHQLKVGDKSAYGARVVQEQTARLKSNGKLVVSDKDLRVQAELGGLREILALDKDGHELKWQLLVKFSTFIRNGQELPVFRADDLIIDEEGDDHPALVNGRPLDKDQQLMLDTLFPPKHGKASPKDGKSSQDDDSEYLPGHKVEVGDTWPVKADHMRSLFQSMGIAINDDAVHGSVTLEGAVPKDGVPCLQTLSEVSLDSQDIKSLASSSKYHGGKFFVLSRVRRNFPVDPTLPDVSEKTIIHSEVETDGTAIVAGGKQENVMLRLLISSEVSTAQLK